MVMNFEVIAVNNIKSVICILTTVALVLCAFSGCGKYVPEKEAEPMTAAATIANPLGSSEKNEENGAVNYSESFENVSVEYPSYFVFGGSYIRIENIRFDKGAHPNEAVFCYDAVLMNKAWKDDKFTFAFKTYDKSGELTRDTVAMVALEGSKSGETIKDCRFTIPSDSVKIILSDYSK